jgi:iron complex outermembrane receptor protein
MYTNNKLSKAVRLAIAFGAASATSFTATVNAQQEGETAKVERIEVTGSRIKRTDMETSSPIQVTTADEIKAGGFTRIEDMLNSLPQIEAADTAFSVNGATGTASLDLRGIGANRTLVLLNGRRLQPGGLYSSASDVNQIPAALVDRVEILTGGGSATYGADAVAGVVNFVMKKDFEGVEINAGYSGYQHDNDNKFIQEKMDQAGYDYKTGNSGLNGKTITLDLTLGGAFADGKGHATAFASYRNVDEMLQGERDYASCAINPGTLACGGSGTAHIPNFDIYPYVDGEVDFDQNAYWSIIDNGGTTEFTDVTNIYNFAPVNHFMRPDKRFTLGSFVNYEVNQHANVYTEINYMQNRTTGQIAESGIFFQNFTFDVNSPIFSAAQQAQFAEAFPGAEQLEIYIGKRNIEGGGRQANLEHNSFRIVTGVEGMINDSWSYDVSYQYGSVSSSDAYKNDFYVNYMAQRLGAVGAPACTGDCIPYEVFTFGGVTTEAARQLQGAAIATGFSTQKILNAFVTGETGFTVPGHSMPVAAVLGVEKRDIFFSRTVDTIYAEGALAGQGGPTTDLDGGYKVDEVFAELSIPLLDNTAIADNLVLELGARYSDYSTSGGENTYKVAVDWSINADWKARASFNKAVRAPNVGELFSNQSIGLWPGDDPCAGANPILTAAQCANTGVTAAQYGNINPNNANQYNGFFGGNPDLQPEKGETITVGIVGNPFENFNFSIDYWNIELTNVISALDPQETITQCGLTGLASYCDLINRAANGSLWLGQAGYVTSTNLNLGEEQYRGIDVSANYSIALGDGTLKASIIGSRNLKKYYNPLPGVVDTDYDCSGLISGKCFAQPEWRHTMSVDYSSGSFWDVGAKWRYFGEVEYDGAENNLIGNKISGQSYIDLVGRFYVNDAVTVQLGVNNIFDKEPPLVGSVLANTNTIGGFWDLLGRYVHLNVTTRF